MDNLKKKCENSLAPKPEKLEFTNTETENFKKAFDDPEFRKMFTEYMDEMQDPKNRQETEEYISQLESEKKVPQGKELVRPKACFVAKTYKLVNGAKGDKIFINIVSSESVKEPIKTVSREGETWSLPYSIGPPHMEKDNNDSNVACFDCCYHPLAVAQMEVVKKFRDSLVHTAIEGVEEAYRAQKQETKISSEYHVLKGISYKNGLIPAMLVDTATKNSKWNNSTDEKVKSAPVLNNEKEKKGLEKISRKGSENVDIMKNKLNDKNDDQGILKKEPVAAIKPSSPLPTPTLAPLPLPVPPTPSAPVNAPASKPVSAIKKGFLSSAKSSIYPESVSAKMKPQTNGLKAPPILLPDSTRKKESGSIRGGLNLSMGNGMEGTGSLVEELTDAQIKQLTKTGNITKTKHIPPPIPVLPTAPVLASVPASGAPSISTPTLPSSDSTTSSPIAALPLPPPIAADSSASSSASPTSPVNEDAHAPSLSSSQTPSNAPQYTLLERGIVSMGDFEALKGRNTSTRPSELVCRISVPLVSKASLMVLDVAERQIQFSYLDIYTLSIPLPFPVFEKKGTAKFDKAAKTLTVTMPVQSSKPSDTEPAPASSAVTVTANQDNENVDESVDEVSPVSADKKKEEIMKGSNSRWIGDDEGTGKEESRKRNEELKKEIKTKSLPVPPSTSVIPSTSTLPPAPPATSVSVPNPPSSSTGSSSSDSSSSSISSSGAGAGVIRGFEPFNSFAGRREGYMFRRGDLGQGYYADVSNSPLAASVPAPAPSSGSLHSSASQPLSVHSSPQSSNPSTSAQSSTLKYTSKSCLIEHRQTKQAIAVLIQVPGILLDSATVSFNDYTVDVEFRALGSDSRILGSGSAHVNPIIATSASVALLTGNNTAINANSILDRTESSLTSTKDFSPDNIELTDLYGFRLTSVVRLSKSLCKYDIASKNMVLVLAKEEEGFHEESDGYKILCMVSHSTGQAVIPVLNSVSPEPKLVSLNAATVKNSNDNEGVEEKKTNKSDNRTDSEKRESLLIDQLNKMKFTTPLNFDLD